MYGYVFYKKFLRNQVYKLSPNSIIQYICSFYVTHFRVSIIWLKITEIQGINLLKTKHRLLYLKSQSVPRCKHFSSRL